jgi:hypothetical protein
MAAGTSALSSRLSRPGTAVGSGGAPDHDRPLLGRWLDSRASNRYSTLRGYESHMRRYLIPYLGQILLADLTTAHIQAMFAAIARQSAVTRQAGHASDASADQGTLTRNQVHLAGSSTTVPMLAEPTSEQREVFSAHRRPHPLTFK